MSHGGQYLYRLVTRRGWCLTAVAAGATLAALSTWKNDASADEGASPTDISNKGSASRDAGLLPKDKLCCKARATSHRNPVVLVCCGSFNPPTVMHMRMVDLAGDDLMRRGYDVWGAYLSPVADAYGKAGLAPARDRVVMCRLAAEDESRASRTIRPPMDGAGEAWPYPSPMLDLTMVYDWEARQPGYTRTLAVLQRVESELRQWVSGAAAEPDRGPSGHPNMTASDGRQAYGRGPGPATAAGCAVPQDQQPRAPAPARAEPSPALDPKPTQDPAPTPQGPRAMLLCGADVLASMAVPGVWRDPDVILRDHGVVCVAREGTDLECLINTPGTVLYDNRERILLVYDRVGNSTSSSKVRQELAAGRPVRYLVPAPVLSYIYEKGLYGTDQYRGAK